ncbi:ribosome maturation factor RimP [Campylobacter sputorum]|uniref:ribosome maturation factor RimP n=1 Tax=Campylobacter sputorum TaxID=206 RepID=UPI00053BFB2A|nr:ribosome maturation factor RimP [Campylobacter sputorum]
MVDLSSLVEQCGVKFYGVETQSLPSKTIYRIFITKDGGINLEDCEKVSKLLSPIFDVEPPVGGDWILEVSSPGLERRLTSIENFANSINELVKITCKNNENLSGKILNIKDNEIILQTQNGEIIINFNDIKKAKTYIEW